jgi:glycosyltransferase involved in cell wall biosynthesis
MTLPPLVCLCHLRWAFTFQRPNHLMVRFAKERLVYYVEEPIIEPPGSPNSEVELRAREVMPNLWVCTPHLPQPDWDATDAQQGIERQVTQLLTQFLRERDVFDPVLWIYTPMALPLLGELQPSVLVYDCMDELTLFAGAPKELVTREQELLSRADLVFTGGHSLYRAKRGQHPAVHAFPSSVDVDHFRVALDEQDAAERPLSAPTDQQNIPRPRIGFFGVIDERMDVDLLRRSAESRPDYQFVLIGPVVKISESELPRAQNIHYLGPKQYSELPAYLHGWDVAIMPFALNDATRFISPTKTLEYLAAAKPVVSTAIADVVTPYGERGLVAVSDAEGFPAALDAALAQTPAESRARAAEALEGTSWDDTWSRMNTLIASMEAKKRSFDDPVLRACAQQPTHNQTGANTCTTT